MTKQQTQGIIVAVYAASPTLTHWDPAVDAAIYHGLQQTLGVRGLELPWAGSLHPYDDAWLVEALRPTGWEVVYTDIQSTVQRAVDDPHFGIASDDPDGRAAAVAVVHGLVDGSRRLNDLLGCKAVLAIELHTQPRGLGGGSGSADALVRSLEEVLSWRRDGVRVLVEHADTAVAQHPTEKGYLPLTAELEALDRIGAPREQLSLELNWGRIAVERQSTDQIPDVIGQARESGWLTSFFFSGAADRPGPYGGEPWRDLHPPFAASPRSAAFEPTSALTEQRAAAALAAAGPVDILGIKFGHRPQDGPVDEVITLLRDSVGLTRELQADVVGSQAR